MEDLEFVVLMAAEEWARSVERREVLEPYEQKLFEAVTEWKSKILKKDWKSNHISALPPPPRVPDLSSYSGDEEDTGRYSDVPTKPSPNGFRVDFGPDEEES